MKLILAEKKQQAEKLAAPFENKPGNGFIEIHPNTIFPKGAYITWAMGHLFSLADPEEYDPKFKKWVLEDLPIMPEEFKYTLIKTKGKQFNIIRDLAKKDQITEIVIGSDPGREGEVIARIIIQMSGVKKPMKRLWTTSLTPNAVTKAFENLLPEKDKRPLFYEAQARAYADWLVGMNTSRAYTILLRQKGEKETFSTGRVQTPLLALILKREEEIESFISSPFWKVFADFHLNSTVLQGKWFKNDMDRLVNEEQARALEEYCKGKGAVITDISTDRKEYHPPQLHSLSTLQLAANRLYKMSPDTVLKICQELYLKEHISYPRSDSQHVTEEEAKDFPIILGQLGALDPYREFIPVPISNLIGNKRYVNSDKVSDHYAIIPTEKIPKLEELTQDEWNIYDLIAKSLIAAHYPEAIFNYTKIVTLVDEKFSFISKGKQMMAEGWRKVLFSAGEEDDEENTILPNVKIGESGLVTNTEMREGKTSPPKRYTEGDLIALMKGAGKSIDDKDAEIEKILEATEGLGTEATRASIIETLKTREYITIKKNLVYPSDKGKVLIQSIGDTSVLKSAVLTGKWEQKLQEIGQGKADHRSFIEQAKRLTQKLVQEATESTRKIVTHKGDSTQTGVEHDASDKGNVDPNNIGTETHADEQTRIKNNDFEERKEQKEGGGPCKICGKEMVDRGKFYGCSSYSVHGCGFTISKQILGVQIPPDQIKLLLEKGETNLIEGFTRKSDQKTFSAVLGLENGKLTFRFPNTNRLVVPLYLLEPLEIISPSEEDTKREFYSIQKEAEALKHPARVIGVTHGPRVSRYELLPNRGINITGYKRFKANFMAALKAKKLSMYIPIPGTNLIGIEVPNKNPYPVQIRGLLENQEYLVKKKDLSFPLGMNLQGVPIFGDLADMPHLLVAGTTGSGKSVFLNSLIISLLYGSSPDRLKFMFIDPKQVELSVYADLPHLFSPIVTQVQKAGPALEHLVKEMNNRYYIFQKSGVRNIISYNQKHPDKKMPYIVLVIDELADLLMTTSDIVEDLILRLAQLARAAGIHMVIATQRPTKKVLSPTIKSNLPVRVAFSVASTADSMTILDEPGAEELLGKGDMFYQPKDSGKIRLQSAYVSDQEIERVVRYLKDKYSQQ
ncbi:DNA topoisomerase 3 [Ammoniphilus resinae]|uniref:DNA topoisomerase III n=1 Tax=Ammoniphilus resinae TaxID=861532 RepID=A0ABS4GNP0_9BACL|nr:DNA topoisomerase 3 [Ammoniphilus resinae]MBP1931892.1 DNA topoisomerase III [Ammoniphilus resinae]